jgi:hypothetical protein
LNSLILNPQYGDIKKSTWVILLACVFIAGAIIPFVDYLVVIEVFYLLIPLGIFLVASLINLVASLFRKGQHSRKAFFMACIVPVFIAAQFISTYTINKIQRHRSALFIREIQLTADETGAIPSEPHTPWGIEFSKSGAGNNFRVSYSGGFTVEEVYDSGLKSWMPVGPVDN